MRTVVVPMAARSCAGRSKERCQGGGALWGGQLIVDSSNRMKQLTERWLQGKAFVQLSPFFVFSLFRFASRIFTTLHELSINNQLPLLHVVVDEIVFHLFITGLRVLFLCWEWVCWKLKSRENGQTGGEFFGDASCFVSSTFYHSFSSSFWKACETREEGKWSLLVLCRYVSKFINRCTVLLVVLYNRNVISIALPLSIHFNSLTWSLPSTASTSNIYYTCRPIQSIIYHWFIFDYLSIRCYTSNFDWLLLL